MVFRRLLDEKLKINEILLQEGYQSTSTNDPSQRIMTWEGHVMMGSHTEAGVEKVILEGEPNPNMIVIQV